MQGVPIDILPFATCVLDKTGVIRGVNDKFAALLGYEDPRIFSGLPIRELVVEKSRQHIEYHIQKCIDAGDADSAPQPVYLLNSMEEELLVYCTISYRKVYDRVLLHIVPAVELETDSLEERLPSQFAKTLLGISDMHALFQRLLQLLSDATGLESAVVFVRDPVNEILKIDARIGLDNELTRLLNNEAASQWGTVSRVLFFSRQLEDVSMPPGLLKYGVKTALLLPVVEDNTLHVMYALFSRSRARFGGNERQDITASIRPLRMITLHVLREQRLESSETLYRSLIRSMPSGVIVRNRNGKIIHYNLVVARIFGQRNDTTLSPEKLFEGLQFFTEDDDPLEVKDLPGMVCLRDGRKVRNIEIRMVRNDKSSVWLSVNSEPLFSPGEKTPYAMVSTFKDISITRRIREELEKTKEEAIVANRSKSSFLANISHEIRTPLSGIMGMTEILLDGDVNADQRQQLLLMKDAEDNLLDIINKVLELSKIESGILTLRRRPFQLESCINKAVYPLYLGKKQKEIRIRIDIEEKIPEQLIGDGNSIQQVLINLVSNAIKFTDQGSIDISVRMYGDIREGKVPLLFMVRDTGTGIPKSEQARIFGSFQQADSSFSKLHQGTGLGLSISKQLIELMGGSIWLESVPDKGTAFFFDLDLSLPAEGGPPPVYHSDPAVLHTATARNILLVEDNPLNQQSVSYFLKEMGHFCSLADNGEDALELLRKNDFDLVLMDVHMPGMNGIEATLRIRQGGEERIRKDIPIIALTAYAMKNEMEKILQSGMNGYVSKPVNREQLFHEIEKTIYKSSLAPEEPAAVYESPESLMIEQVLTGRNGFSSFVEDYRTDIGIAGQLLALFVRDVPGRIELIEKALQDKDGSELADNFHSLTNNLSAIRLHKIGQHTREMEKQALSGNFHYISDRFQETRTELDLLIAEARRYLLILNMMK